MVLFLFYFFFIFSVNILFVVLLFGQFAFFFLLLICVPHSHLISCSSLFSFHFVEIYLSRQTISERKFSHIFKNLAYINQPRLPSIFTNQLLTENLCIFEAYIGSGRLSTSINTNGNVFFFFCSNLVICKMCSLKQMYKHTHNHLYMMASKHYRPGPSCKSIIHQFWCCCPRPR